MAFVVAFSRMFLGVHTIFDIIGGILESAVMIVVADKVFAYAWKSEENVTFSVIELPSMGLQFHAK